MKEVIQEAIIETKKIAKRVFSEFVREALNSELQYKSQYNQNRCVNVISEPPIGSEKQDGNGTLYFDDEINLLWLDAEKKAKLEPKDADVLSAIIDVLLKKNRRCCRREEILLKVYNVEVSPQQKLPEVNNDLTSAISTINGKCKKQLGMSYNLIQKDGLRTIKLSRNVEIRKV